MKRILVWIIMLHIYGAVPAQNKIKKYEYWVDDNLAGKVVTSITPAQTFHLISAFPVGQVSEGFHMLHIRFADTADVWSSVISQYFMKYPQNVSVSKQIVAYEYWVDNGYSNKVLQNISPSQFYRLNTNLDFSAISAGFHLLNIRFKDSMGEWSGVLTQYFMKYPANVSVPKQIVAYEYWVDNSYSNKISQNVTPTQYFHLNSNLNLSSIPVGFHLLHFRFKDSMGEWSGILTQYFMKYQVAESVNNKLIAYRYWFDNDFATAISINISNPVKYFHLIDSVETPFLSIGSHVINYHFKDSLRVFSSVLSESFEVTSCLPHQGKAISGPTTVCPGQTGMCYYSAPIGNATGYQWTLPQGFSIIAGGNTNSITVSCTSGAFSGTITVKGTNSCGTGPNSPPLNVSVNPLPAPTITGQMVACINTPGIGYNTETGMSDYAWSVSSGGIITSGAGTPAVTVTWNNPGTQTVSVSYLHSNGCGAGIATKSVTVEPIPTVNPIANQKYCNGESVPSMSITGPVAGTTFTWTNSNPAIGLPPAGSGNIPGFTAINTGTAPAVAMITIIPAANGCTGPILTFTIVVSPTPLVNAVANQFYYNGNAAPMTPITGPVSGTTFTWANSNVSIGLPASGSGNVPGFVATNAGSATITATVTITPAASGCTGPNSAYMITVYPTQVTCTLSVTPASQNVPASPAGATTFAITSNCEWTASSSQTWCTVTPSGTGNATLVANYAINTGTTARTATITVTVSGQPPVLVMVTQNAAPCTLSVTPASQNVPASPAGATTFAIESNCDWTAVSDQMWCTVTPLGSGNGTLEANYAVNTGTVTRTATVTVAVSGQPFVVVTVTQVAAGPCEPSWQPVQNQQYSMHVIANLFLSGVLSLNSHDAVGAFVGNECRGMAHPVPSMNGLVFLTITSDLQAGETITFKAWKSATCEECPIAETVTFVDPSEIGTLTNPFSLHCGSVELCIDFGAGYTWFSVNVNPGSMALNSLFGGLTPCDNDRIIGQQTFAIYYSGHWVGSLKTINPVAMYKMKLCAQQRWCTIGNPAPIVPIAIGSGYPWIGYLPQVDLPINTALAGIVPAPVMNDRMEAQTSFASYTGSQWVGSLTTMQRGKGYIIALANPSVLTYPTGFDHALPEPASEKIRTLHPPNGDYPDLHTKYNMQIVAAIMLPGNIRSTDPSDVVYVYCGDECRGMASPEKDMNGYLFLNVGSNVETGEKVTFRVYIFRERATYEITNRLEFSSLQETGTMDAPYELDISDATVLSGGQQVDETLYLGEIHPNPVDDKAFLEIRVPRPCHVSAFIINNVGEVIALVTDSDLQPGGYNLMLNATALKPGIYMLRITYTDDLTQRYFTKKMVVNGS